MPMSSARILVASDYNVATRAYYKTAFEFCRVVGACHDAEILAPDRRVAGLNRDLDKVLDRIRSDAGLKHHPTMTPVALKQDYELFFFVCWNLHGLVQLSRIKDWRRRCAKAAVFINEIWSSSLLKNRGYARLLDSFDHVFVANRSVIPTLQQCTSTRCTFLAPGVDCLTASPFPQQPDRVIDVYSFGRRPAGIHRQLLALAEQQRIFYLYDSLSSSDSLVKDWREHHLLIANNIKRSRYVLAFNPAAAGDLKSIEVNGEQVLSARLFEGAAGGAVMIGTPPRTPDFEQYFNWPDAVIDIPPDPSDAQALLTDLDRQPERMCRARQTGAIECLRRHDWVYRWEQVLEVLGITAPTSIAERKFQLRRLAELASARDLRELSTRIRAGTASPSKSRG